MNQQRTILYLPKAERKFGRRYLRHYKIIVFASAKVGLPMISFSDHKIIDLVHVFPFKK